MWESVSVENSLFSCCWNKRNECYESQSVSHKQKCGKKNEDEIMKKIAHFMYV